MSTSKGMINDDIGMFVDRTTGDTGLITRDKRYGQLSPNEEREF